MLNWTGGKGVSPGLPAMSAKFYPAKADARLWLKTTTRSLPTATSDPARSRTIRGPLADARLGLPRQKKFDQAIADFTKAIELYPQDYESYGAGGRLPPTGRSRQGDCGHHRGPAAEPHVRPGYLHRGRQLEAKGEHNKAIADFTQAIRLGEQSSSRFVTGHRLHREWEYDKAITDFTEAIRLDPKNAFAYVGRGRLRRKRRPDREIAELTEAIRVAPSSRWPTWARNCVPGSEEYDKPSPTSRRHPVESEDFVPTTIEAALILARRTTTRRSPTSPKRFGWIQSTRWSTATAALLGTTRASTTTCCRLHGGHSARREGLLHLHVARSCLPGEEGVRPGPWRLSGGEPVGSQERRRHSAIAWLLARAGRKTAPWHEGGGACRYGVQVDGLEGSSYFDALPQPTPKSAILTRQ